MLNVAFSNAYLSFVTFVTQKTKVIAELCRKLTITKISSEL